MSKTSSTPSRRSWWFVIIGLIVVVFTSIVFIEPWLREWLKPVPITNTTAPTLTADTVTEEQKQPKKPSDYYLLLKTGTRSEEGDIVSYDFGSGNRVSIMPASMKDLTLAENSIKSSRDVKVGTVSGQRLVVSSAKDGSAVNIVQVTRGETLFDFRGDEAFLNSLDSYIQFIN